MCSHFYFFGSITPHAVQYVSLDITQHLHLHAHSKYTHITLYSYKNYLFLCKKQLFHTISCLLLHFKLERGHCLYYRFFCCYLSSYPRGSDFLLQQQQFRLLSPDRHYLVVEKHRQEPHKKIPCYRSDS